MRDPIPIDLVTLSPEARDVFIRFHNGCYGIDLEELADCLAPVIDLVPED